MPLPLVALILAVFSLGTAESVIAGLLPFLAGDLEVSVASAGLLVSAYALTVVVAGPVVTLLTTRLPRRALLVGLTGCFAAGNVLAAIAPNYGVLMAAGSSRRSPTARCSRSPWWWPAAWSRRRRPGRRWQR
ncbi:hypothetical protein GCM10027610_039070 [Dactylosporangium cerinum]